MTNSPDPTYDLFVIGGGINGAGIACDAAGRGLSVGLAEMQDFAEGTSSRSSKLVHGGLRYLETYDFKLVRDALLEREVLMAKAPHLVRPLRLVLPHVQGLRPRWMLRLGLFLYDHLAKRNSLLASESLRLDKHPAGAPLKDIFRHGFAYSDCRGDDSRLVIANLLGAQSHGADIYARHRFHAAKRMAGLWHIDLEETRSGKRRAIVARGLVNAAGPWVIKVGSRVEGVSTRRRLRMVRGSHLVVPSLWDGGHGYFLQTRDQRLMEIFPYEEDFTCIGTTDEPWEDAPESVVISDKEIDYMIEETNRYLKRPVTRGDIVWSYSGVRPLFEVGGARDSSLSTLTRDYSFELDHEGGKAPVLTVYGGKLTTFRRLGEAALAKLEPYLNPSGRCRTSFETLPGGDFGPEGMEAFERELGADCPWLPPGQLRRYVRTYGTRARELLSDARSFDELGPCFGADLTRREVDFLMETEWAMTAEDIVWRRTKLGLRLTRDEIAAVSGYVEGQPIA